MGFFGSSTRGATGFAATGATAFGASGFTAGFTATAAAGFEAGGGAALDKTGFTGALTDAATLTGAFTAGFAAAGFAAAFEAVTFAPLLAVPLEEAFDAGILEPAALGATFAVLWGIALLFLEDATVLPVLRVSLFDARARLFVALRRAAAAFLDAFKDFAADDFAADFFEGLDALVLRVFWATTNRAEPPRPCLMIFGSYLAATSAVSGSGLWNCAYNSTFPAKINDLSPFRRPQRGQEASYAA